MSWSCKKSGENTQPMLSHNNRRHGVDRNYPRADSKPSPKWWVGGDLRVLTANRWYAQLLDVTRPISFGLVSRNLPEAGLPALTSGSLRIKTALGVMMFLRQEDFCYW